MNKPLFLICYCLFSLSDGYAQNNNCGDTSVLSIKGKWTMLANNIVYPEKAFPSSQYNQLYTRLDKIANLFQQALPQPAGLEAEWYRSIRGAAIVRNGPVPYQFNSLYESWYCNRNLHKLMLSPETGTWSYVFINDLHWFLNDQDDLLWMKINNSVVYFLPLVKEQWKGENVYAVSANHTKSKAILITQNGKLPYKPISRLSFLQAQKEKLETDKTNQLNAINKTQEKAIQLARKYFDDRLKIIEDVWKNLSNEDLQQPAIIENRSDFKGFSSLEKGGRMLVVIDPGYFNTQLPKYVPQLIMLYWQYDNNPAAQNFKKELEENFPLDKLKAMINK